MENPDDFTSTMSPKTTLSELDEKAKARMEVLQEDVNPSPQSAEIHQEKRLKLMNLFRELSGSYRSLAENYEASVLKPDHKHGSPSCNPEAAVDYPDADGSVDACFRDVNKHEGFLVTESFRTTSVIEIEDRDNRMSSDRKGTGIFQMGYDVSGSSFLELKVQAAKLMDENLRHQEELIKRNDEKRATIHKLQLQMERLKVENLVLRNRLGSSSQRQRLGGKFQIPRFGRLFKIHFHRR